MLGVIRRSIEKGETKEAIEYLINHEQHLQIIRKSRFYNFYFDEQLKIPRYQQVLERSVSIYFDMQNRYAEDMYYFYLENDGSFHKITASGPLTNPPNKAKLDEFYRENPTTITYTRPGNLIANNKIVGSVSYSNH